MRPLAHFCYLQILALNPIKLKHKISAVGHGRCLKADLKIARQDTLNDGDAGLGREIVGFGGA